MRRRRAQSDRAGLPLLDTRGQCADRESPRLDFWETPCGTPPLKFNNMIESNPLTSRFAESTEAQKGSADHGLLERLAEGSRVHRRPLWSLSQSDSLSASHPPTTMTVCWLVRNRLLCACLADSRVAALLLTRAGCFARLSAGLQALRSHCPHDQPERRKTSRNIAIRPIPNRRI